VEFHMWYLKNKLWVERTENGYLAITVQGVDQVEQGQLLLMPDHLIEADDPARRDAVENEDMKSDRNLLVSE
jgi:hypothetical protein